MRSALFVCLLALSACSAAGDPALVGPTPTPVEVPFRVLSEGQNATFCVEGPEFALAKSDDAWIGVYSRQSDCAQDGEFTVPQVNFDDPDAPEWAVAAWWKVEGCLGYQVRTSSIVLRGDTAVVRARSTGPGGVCATALGGLESFLAVRADALADARRISFVLDGEEVGTLDASRTRSG